MRTRVERAVVLGADSRAQRSSVEMRLDRLRAPFSLRCGALLIDYTVLMSIVAFTTLVARSFGGGARTAGSTIEVFGYLIAVGAAVLNFIVLAAWRGQTLGKWATGLRIECRKDVAPPGLGRALVRHLIGYPLSLLTFGIGFIMAALNHRGRALHDIIAGTVVVRCSTSARRLRSVAG